MSREQQDVQSFADGNLQHELYLSNWRVKIINRAINAFKKINRSTALYKSSEIMLTSALTEWVCVSGGEPERSGPKI